MIKQAKFLVFTLIIGAFISVQAMEKSNNYFDQLPIELQAKAMGHSGNNQLIAALETLFASRLVCPSWYRLLKDHYVLKHFFNILLLPGTSTSLKAGQDFFSFAFSDKNNHPGEVAFLRLLVKKLKSGWALDPSIIDYVPLGALREAKIREGTKLLITLGAKNRDDENDLAPLHIAATNDETEMAEFLLATGTPVDIQLPISCETPLHRAALYNNIKSATLLLKRGANIEALQCVGFTPLHYAAYKNHLDMALLLLQNGAVVDSKSKGNLTPLHKAAEHGRTTMMELLLSYGADRGALDNNGDSSLHIAARKCHTSAVEFLLSQGVDCNSVGFDRHTVLHIAAFTGNVELAKLLIQSGAKIDLKTGPRCVYANKTASEIAHRHSQMTDGEERERYRAIYLMLKDK